MEPLARARTEQHNESRPFGGAVDTYEDRTLVIMQQIWDLSDNYDRLHAKASSLQPYPEDHYQRLQQLYTSIRDYIDELRHDCTQYTLVMGDWDVLATERLSEDSEWSRKMLQHRRAFFEDPAFIPKLLDEKQLDLLEYYTRLQLRIEDIVDERDAAAQATLSRDPPTYSVGAPRMLLTTEQTCASIRLGQQLPLVDDAYRRRRPIHEASRPRNVYGEELPPPISMGWASARGGAHKNSQRTAAYSAARAAPSPDPASYSATGPLAGRESSAATSQPGRPDPDRVKAMMSTYAPSAAAGRGPALSSGPLQVGADGKPLSKSDADAKPPTFARGAADFGQEETSAFYRNASYQPSANASSIQQPTWTLALKPLYIAPFDRDIRAYPTFRNHFLEIIESQPGLNSRHKLQYLLQYLRVEPYHMASSFMITDAYYFRVLERLEETYGDRGTLVWRLSDTLHSLPQPSENENDLRLFHDESARLVAELRQSGENPDANSVITQNLPSKLPHSVRLEVIRRADQNLPTISVILEKLHDHLRVPETADTMSLNSSAWASSGLLRRGDQRSYSGNQPTSSQRYGNFMADSQVLVAQCPLCSGPHWPSRCTLYDTTNKRLRRVLKLKFCLLCLKGGHQAGMCPKKNGEPCRYCGHGEHHQALCKDLQQRREELRPGPMSAKKKGPAPQKVLNVAAAALPASEAKPISPSRSVRQESSSVSWLKPPSTVEATVWFSRPPSAQISSESGLSNSTNNATKPPQGPRTDPDGLPGTSRPTTVVHESMISKDVHASDASELLLTQKCLRTDKCSTQDEMVQFDREFGLGSHGEFGLRDAYRMSELCDKEDASPNKPSGQLNDLAWVSSVEPTPSGQLAGPKPTSAPDKTTPRFANKTFRSEDDASTPLLECLIATAKNPWTDDTAD